MTLVEKGQNEDVHVLLVEDDEDDRFIVRQSFIKTRHKVFLEEVEHGQEALDLLDSITDVKKLPDMILLDLNMPIMDGRKFLQKARADERYKDLPIVVLTTSTERDILDEAKALGANATLSKAVRISDTQKITQMIIDLWMHGTISWEFYEAEIKTSVYES